MSDCIFKVNTISFDIDNGSGSVHFIRYWYDRTTNKAWNYGTATITTGEGYQYSLANTPGQIDDTFTPIKPF